jgi:LPS export ABC transporter protein LptC
LFQTPVGFGQAPGKINRKAAKLFAVLVCLFLVSCSFDYGNAPAPDRSQPDIVMRDVEYVRVRSGDPVVRFQAEEAERYEQQQTMNLKNFSFEQFENHGNEINAAGSAGEARVELDSGNIRLGGGVKITVDSDDITIATSNLTWQDKDRRLEGAPGGEVEITRSDGTGFSGLGFSADARRRTWNFEAGVSGSYTESEKEADDEEKLSEETAAAGVPEIPEVETK